MKNDIIDERSIKKRRRFDDEQYKQNEKIKKSES